jgi:hypothetical protein
MPGRNPDVRVASVVGLAVIAITLCPGAGRPIGLTIALSLLFQNV